ncbi:MAG: methyltransferase domain-containing protein [Thermoleophilia bacterium]
MRRSRAATSGGFLAREFTSEVENARDETVELLISLAEPTAADVVMDYSVAPSVAALTVAPMVKALDAVADMADILEEGRRLAKALGVETISFRQVDLFALPYEAKAFTLAIACESLSQSHDPVAALKELRRVVAAGGRLVIVEPVVDESLDAVFNDIARLRQPAHRRYFRQAELESLAADAGLHASRSMVARSTVDLSFWLQTAGATSERAASVNKRFRALPVAAQIAMDVAFTDDAISFSYDILGLRFECA